MGIVLGLNSVRNDCREREIFTDIDGSGRLQGMRRNGPSRLQRLIARVRACVDARLYGFPALNKGVPMRFRKSVCGVLFVAFMSLCRQSWGGDVVFTPVQIQSTAASGGLTPTNWSASTAGINNPLVFNQFNPSLGTLLSVDITLTTNIRNDYELIFVPTPIITTIDVATTSTTDPAVLNDPSLRASLTDGPSVTLFGPNGAQIFGAPATRQPVDFVQMTESSGTWSSLLPVTDSHYIAPTVTQQSFSRSLTASDSPSLFSDFIGTGTVGLPVAATAYSSFFSSSGNGGGAVLTEANASVEIQYAFVGAQQLTPEPASILLLAVGFTGILVARRKSWSDRQQESARAQARILSASNTVRCMN